MLQQTRVQTVVSYYERFLRELPTIQALAEAPEEQVLSLWSGLGYYRRARMLQRAAKQVASAHGGRIPSEVKELRGLAGVGAYTAGAIASITFGRRAPLVDGNVARVLSRLFAVDDDVKSPAGRSRLWGLAEGLVTTVEGDPGDWNQALMELGATVCTPGEPRCLLCPVRESCRARAQGIESTLPRAAAKRPPREVRRVAIVLASTQAVLLARRRRELLWGGLWEPPSAEGELQALAAELHLDASRLVASGRVLHVLTHRRMHVEVARGVLPRQRRWSPPTSDYDAIEAVPFSEIAALPHSTLTRKVLTVANLPSRGLRWKK
jgi:A/G-specific adenine glycosylase